MGRIPELIEDLRLVFHLKTVRGLKIPAERSSMASPTQQSLGGGGKNGGEPKNLMIQEDFLCGDDGRKIRAKSG